jgi:hypothetical protein
MQPAKSHVRQGNGSTNLAYDEGDFYKIKIVYLLSAVPNFDSLRKFSR